MIRPLLAFAFPVALWASGGAALSACGHGATSMPSSGHSGTSTPSSGHSGTSTPAPGHAATGAPTASAPGAPPARGSMVSRPQIMAQLNAIRTERLQSALGVPPAMAKTVADRWGQFDQEAHDRRQGFQATRQRIQEVLMGPGNDEEKNAQVAPLISQCVAIQKQQRDAKERFEAEIQRTLTPVQQARLFLLMDEFQRRLSEILPEHHRDH